jgi:hypothetical protein
VKKGHQRSFHQHFGLPTVSWTYEWDFVLHVKQPLGSRQRLPRRYYICPTIGRIAFQSNHAKTRPEMRKVRMVGKAFREKPPHACVTRQSRPIQPAQIQNSILGEAGQQPVDVWHTVDCSKIGNKSVVKSDPVFQIS